MNSPYFKQRVTQKAERYKFAGASDEERSELLKDVLAMAAAVVLADLLHNIHSRLSRSRRGRCSSRRPAESDRDR